MIDVKQAVGNALRFADDVFAGENLIDARLEEVQRSEDERVWRVTLSFVRQASKLKELLGPPSREYKVFAIDADTGDVQWMRIR